MKLGDDSLKGIAEMAPPENYTKIWRFLGVTGFFQCFIKNYAQIARPLNDPLKEEDDKYHPVAYASWELKGAEKKYHSSKLEFLAFKWAITDQSKEYLWYKPFTVCTDNNPLTYVMTTPNLDAIGHRWIQHDHRKPERCRQQDPKPGTSEVEP